MQYKPVRLISSTMKLFQNTINPTEKTHSASVIFFHGSGDSGSNVLEWVRSLLARNMEFPHIKVIYPTAPIQPYTPANGELWNVWFDRSSIAIEASENRQSLSSIYGTVNKLINEEVGRGIPANRIIVGGFSMGGTLAMHAAYHLNPDLAGVFACSSFLNRDSIVYDSLKNRTKFQDLKMFHGQMDPVVPIEWGKETFDKLISLGVKGEFVPLNDTMHELIKHEILDVEKWIGMKLPP